MYHIIYMTTNKINNKIYIGMHSTYNLNDNYLGSGHALESAIKKYGRNNFKKDIIHFCYSIDELIEWETLIVDNTFVSRLDTYNIRLGGGNKGKVSEETKLKISNTTKGRIGRKLTPEQLEKHKLNMKIVMNNPSTKMKCSIAKKGKSHNHTIESKAKISYAQKNLTKEQLKNKSESKKGNKNPMFGKKYYNNGIECKSFVPGNEPFGWILGRLFNHS